MLLLGVIVSKVVVNISVVFFVLSDGINNIQKSGIGGKFPIVDRYFRSRFSNPAMDFAVGL